MSDFNYYFLGGLLLGVILGTGIMFLWLAYRIKGVIARIESAVNQEVDEHFIGVNIEKHGKLYRFYNDKTGQFIMQTDTLDELSVEFNRLYPTKTCYIAGGPPEVVDELKSVLAKRD